MQGVIDDDADEGNGIANDELCIPAGMAALFGVREDVEVVMARKWAGMAAASRDMTSNGYNRLTGYPPDLVEANNQRAAAEPNKLRVIGVDLPGGAGWDNADLPSGEDNIADDDSYGLQLTTFNMLGDLNPWVTGEEQQGIDDLVFTRLNTIKNNITVTSGTITDAQKQVIVDVSTMPDFH